MNKQIFLTGIIEIQDNFGAQYNETMKNTIWSIASRWRETSFHAVVKYLKEEFKKSYGVELPFPRDFKDAIREIHIEEEKSWKVTVEPEKPIDFEGWKLYQKAKSELLKKWEKNENFILKSSRINGVFACEICHRAKCDGKPEHQILNGCLAFLSEEDNKKLEKKRSEFLGQTEREAV